MKQSYPFYVNRFLMEDHFKNNYRTLTLYHIQQICSKQFWKYLDENMENLCKINEFNTFPHTTILEQTTLNIFCQKKENLYNWMNNLRLKVENIVAKGEKVYMRERVNSWVVGNIVVEGVIYQFEQLFLLPQCCRKLSAYQKGLTLSLI